MSDSPTIEPVNDIRAVLGECPVWDARSSDVYWIDIEDRLVHRTDPANGSTESREMPGRPGSFVLTDDPDRLVVAIEHMVCELHWPSGDVQNLVRLEPDDNPARLNDGRCDRVGRFWVGSMDESDGSPPAGMFHRVDTDLSVETVRQGVGVSNGLAFSPDGSVMYWADTRRDTVWAYDYDLSTGEQRNERVFLDFADLPGKPDGGCVDADGCYWVACVYGWAMLRATPDGDVDRIIDLPVEKPSMPAFGGRALDTMFITSISRGGSTPASPGQPLAGALLVLDPGVTGLAEPHFAG